MRMPVAISLWAVSLASCQTYDFEKVEPLAISQTTQSTQIGAAQLKPNLMLLVDNSGSMNTPIYPPLQPQCGACGPTMPCPSNCPTRISELVSSMSSFLASAGSIARMGLAVFPVGALQTTQCAAPSRNTVELPAPAADDSSNTANIEKAMEIETAIRALKPGGGTPTNSSLRFVGSIEGLHQADHRSDFVLLLTDGVPNCNSQNPNNCCGDLSRCDDPSNACQCTTLTCGSPTFCSAGCLDRQGVVEAVLELRAKDIKTIVVGFGIGDSLGGDQQNAHEVLNAMADTGGFPRGCETDAECGRGDTCNQSNHTCNQKFYRATNGAELSAALKAISEGIGGKICERDLDAQPPNEKFLAVIVDGVNLASGPDTWVYQNAKVIFQGSTCDRLQAAKESAPIDVQIRIVTTL